MCSDCTFASACSHLSTNGTNDVTVPAKQIGVLAKCVRRDAATSRRGWAELTTAFSSGQVCCIQVSKFLQLSIGSIVVSQLGQG